MPTADDTRHLRDYLDVIRRRKAVLALTILLVLGAAIGATFLQTKVYEASSTVLLQPRSRDEVLDSSTRTADLALTVPTEIEVIKSVRMTEEVRNKIGSAPGIKATQVGQTAVIKLTARSASARRAAAIANAYAEAFIELRRRTAIDDLLEAGQETQARIAQLQRQLDSLNSQIDGAPQSQKEAVTRTLGPQRDALVGQLAVLKGRGDQLQVAAAFRTGAAQMVTPAVTPTTPASPQPVRNAIAGLAAGVIVGLAFAFLLEHLDDTLKSKEDLERATKGLPPLGLIPAVPGWKDRGEPFLVSRVDPASSAAEAYRTLRTSIFFGFFGLDRPMRTLQITSSSASEGKTTTLSNLGVVLARAGQPVVLVDCDLRRPRLARFFGLPNRVGLTSVLLGEVGFEDALQPVPGEPGLSVLGSGPLPPNPSELLSSGRMVELLASMRAAGIILIDSPPVLPVADSVILAGRVDGTLLVASARVTTKREIARSMELLQGIDAPLVGTVLNGVTQEGGYGYAYTYTYSSRQPGERVRGSQRQ